MGYGTLPQAARPSASEHWQLTNYSATATGGPHSPGSSANKNPARQNEKAWKQVTDDPTSCSKRTTLRSATEVKASNSSQSPTPLITP